MDVGSIELLRVLSWRAEKLLRKRGQLYGVLWLIETTAREREFFETICDSAPSTATDTAMLQELIRQTHEDFVAARVVAFACAFRAARVIRRRRVEAARLAPPVAELHTDVVVIEAHDSEGEHWRVERELIELKPGRPILGAMSAIELAPDSLYANILGLAARLQATA
jgi:hypothetical protein